MKIAKFVAPALLLVCLSIPAKAQEHLAKFIEHYNGVQVRIEESSKACNVADKDTYAKQVGEGLTAMGITPNPQAFIRAYLFIWAIPFGPLNQQCTAFMSLRLGADVSSAVATIDAKVVSDKILIEKIKVVAGTFPASFYITSRLFVRLKIDMSDYIVKTIGQLLGNIEKVRGS